jgi:hypothetical protein
VTSNATAKYPYCSTICVRNSSMVGTRDEKPGQLEARTIGR